MFDWKYAGIVGLKSGPVKKVGISSKTLGRYKGNEFLKKKNPKQEPGMLGGTVTASKPAHFAAEVFEEKEEEFDLPDEYFLKSGKNDSKFNDEYFTESGNNDLMNGIKWTVVVVCILIGLYLVWLGISKKEKIYLYVAIVPGVAAVGSGMFMTSRTSSKPKVKSQPSVPPPPSSGGSTPNPCPHHEAHCAPTAAQWQLAMEHG